MPSILLPSRMNQQPQQAAVVDWGNPSSAVLRAAAVPGIAEAVSGAFARTVAGGVDLGATSAGRAWVFNGGSALDFPNIPYQAPPFSLLVVVRKSTLVADTLVSFGGVGGARGWKFGSGGAATTARLTYGGVADYNLATGFWDTDGGITIALLVVSGTTAKLFKPRRLVSTSTVGNPSATAPTRPLTIGASFSTFYTEFSTSTVNFVQLHGRAMPDAEALAMVDQVYQLLNPPARRLWFADAGVTPGPASYAYAANGGLVLAGASPRVAGKNAAASGGVILSGSSLARRGGVRAAAGGLTLSGAAASIRSRLRTVAGGLLLSGAAAVASTSAVQARVVAAAGGLLLAGASSMRRGAGRVASGGLSLAGSAGLSFASVFRRALVLIGVTLRQVRDNELATGQRPVVLVNGRLRRRQAAEGTPLVLDNGEVRPLAPDETLKI